MLVFSFVYLRIMNCLPNRLQHSEVVNDETQEAEQDHPAQRPWDPGRPRQRHRGGGKEGRFVVR